MFKHFGRLVEKLKRVRIGPIDLGPLKPGQFRLSDRRGSGETQTRARSGQTAQGAPVRRAPTEPV